MALTFLQKIYKECFEKWGLDAQVIMFNEELASAIKSLSHLYRDYNETNLAEFKDELADALVMIDEFMYEYQIDTFEIAKIKAEKIDRLLEKLKTSNEVKSSAIKLYEMEKIESTFKCDIVHYESLTLYTKIYIEPLLLYKI